MKRYEMHESEIPMAGPWWFSHMVQGPTVPATSSLRNSWLHKALWLWLVIIQVVPDIPRWMGRSSNLVALGVNEHKWKQTDRKMWCFYWMPWPSWQVARTGCGCATAYGYGPMPIARKGWKESAPQKSNHKIGKKWHEIASQRSSQKAKVSKSVARLPHTSWDIFLMGMQFHSSSHLAVKFIALMVLCLDPTCQTMLPGTSRTAVFLAVWMWTSPLLPACPSVVSQLLHAWKRVTHGWKQPLWCAFSEMSKVL